MVGKEHDWKSMIDAHLGLESMLEPLEDLLDLREWFISSRLVLQKLLETRTVAPVAVDKQWWSHIITRHQPHGSGTVKFSGWFVNDLLGKKKKKKIMLHIVA